MRLAVARASGDEDEGKTGRGRLAIARWKAELGPIVRRSTCGWQRNTT